MMHGRKNIKLSDIVCHVLLLNQIACVGVHECQFSVLKVMSSVLQSPFEKGEKCFLSARRHASYVTKTLFIGSGDTNSETENYLHSGYLSPDCLQCEDCGC